MIEGSLGSSLFCSPGYFRLQVLPDDPGDNTYGHTRSISRRVTAKDTSSFLPGIR